MLRRALGKMVMDTTIHAAINAYLPLVMVRLVSLKGIPLDKPTIFNNWAFVAWASISASDLPDYITLFKKN